VLDKHVEASIGKIDRFHHQRGINFPRRAQRVDECSRLVQPIDVGCAIVTHQREREEAIALVA
jgi:hypothetical protein